jgi:3,4-dihydroxy-2-butanone 4-phosphate synthase
MARREMHRPGEIVPRSAQAEIVGPRGGHTGEERTVTIGERFPPTPQKGQRYVIVDPTKHRRKG